MSGPGGSTFSLPSPGGHQASSNVGSPPKGTAFPSSTALQEAPSPADMPDLETTSLTAVKALAAKYGIQLQALGSGETGLTTSAGADGTDGGEAGNEGEEEEEEDLGVGTPFKITAKRMQGGRTMYRFKSRGHAPAEALVGSEVNGQARNERHDFSPTPTAGRRRSATSGAPLAMLHPATFTKASGTGEVLNVFDGGGAGGSGSAGLLRKTSLKSLRGSKSIPSLGTHLSNRAAQNAITTDKGKAKDEGTGAGISTESSSMSTATHPFPRPTWSPTGPVAGQLWPPPPPMPLLPVHQLPTSSAMSRLETSPTSGPHGRGTRRSGVERGKLEGGDVLGAILGWSTAASPSGTPRAKLAKDRRHGSTSRTSGRDSGVGGGGRKRASTTGSTMKGERRARRFASQEFSALHRTTTSEEGVAEAASGVEESVNVEMPFTRAANPTPTAATGSRPKTPPERSGESTRSRTSPGSNTLSPFGKDFIVRTPSPRVHARSERQGSGDGIRSKTPDVMLQGASGPLPSSPSQRGLALHAVGPRLREMQSFESRESNATARATGDDDEDDGWPSGMDKQGRTPTPGQAEGGQEDDSGRDVEEVDEEDATLIFDVLQAYVGRPSIDSASSGTSSGSSTSLGGSFQHRRATSASVISVTSSVEESRRHAQAQETVTSSAPGDDPRFAIWGLRMLSGGGTVVMAPYDHEQLQLHSGGTSSSSLTGSGSGGPGSVVGSASTPATAMGSPVSAPAVKRWSLRGTSSPPAAAGATAISSSDHHHPIDPSAADKWGSRRASAQSRPESTYFPSAGGLGGRRVLIAATRARLIAELTSEIDHRLLTDFFLTYRSYLDPLDLLHLLTLRFQWALGKPVSPADEAVRRIVRVRTFVVLRHWLLNYFAHDFLANRALRAELARWLNEVYKDPAVRNNPRDLSIIKSLKKVVRRLKASYLEAGVAGVLGLPNTGRGAGSDRPRTTAADEGRRLRADSTNSSVGSASASAASVNSYMGIAGEDDTSAAAVLRANGETLGESEELNASSDGDVDLELEEATAQIALGATQAGIGGGAAGAANDSSVRTVNAGATVGTHPPSTTHASRRRSVPMTVMNPSSAAAGSMSVEHSDAGSGFDANSASVRRMQSSSLGVESESLDISALGGSGGGGTFGRLTAGPRLQRGRQGNNPQSMQAAPPPLPHTNNAISRVFVNAVGRLSRFKRVLGARSGSMTSASSNFANEVGFDDLEFEASDTGDLLYIRGGIENFLSFFNLPAPGQEGVHTPPTAAAAVEPAMGQPHEAETEQTKSQIESSPPLDSGDSGTPAEEETPTLSESTTSTGQEETPSFGESVTSGESQKSSTEESSLQSFSAQDGMMEEEHGQAQNGAKGGLGISGVSLAAESSSSLQPPSSGVPGLDDYNKAASTDRDHLHHATSDQTLRSVATSFNDGRITSGSMRAGLSSANSGQAVAGCSTPERPISHASYRYSRDSPKVVQIDDLDSSDDDDDGVVRRALRRLPGARDLRMARTVHDLDPSFAPGRRSFDTMSSLGQVVDRVALRTSYAPSFAPSERSNAPRAVEEDVASDEGMTGVGIVEGFHLDGVESDDDEPGDVEAALRRLEGVIDEDKQREKARRVEVLMKNSMKYLDGSHAHHALHDDLSGVSEEATDDGASEISSRTSMVSDASESSIAEEEDLEEEEGQDDVDVNFGGAVEGGGAHKKVLSNSDVGGSPQMASQRYDPTAKLSGSPALSQRALPTEPSSPPLHPVGYGSSTSSPSRRLSKAGATKEFTVIRPGNQPGYPHSSLRVQAGPVPGIERPLAPSNFNSWPIPLIHRSFLLLHRSEVVAQQLCLIERDLYQAVGWEELVSLTWKERPSQADILDWEAFVKQRARQKVEAEAAGEPVKGRAVEAIIARFNLTCNWVASEIVLTRAVEERAALISKFIRVAWKCYQQSNFATLAQIVYGLQSPWVERLRKTWARIGMWEMRVLRDLKTFTSPLRNFRHLRNAMSAVAEESGVGAEDALSQSLGTAGAGMTGAGSGISQMWQQAMSSGKGNRTFMSGCIPFLGLYLSDLAQNDGLPSYIDPSCPSSSVETDPDTGELILADPKAFERLPQLPPSIRLEPLVNVHKYRVAASVVKTLIMFQDRARRYTYEADGSVFVKCLKIRCLDPGTMTTCSNMVEPP